MWALLISIRQRMIGENYWQPKGYRMSKEARDCREQRALLEYHNEQHDEKCRLLNRRPRGRASGSTC